MADHKDIESLIERADRQLDGMTVNRDAFARDAKQIAWELKRWREAFARMPADKRSAWEELFGQTFRGAR